LVTIPTESEVAEMADGNKNLIDNLREKLGVRFENDSELDDAIDDALRVFLESQNAVSQLRNLAPDAYEEITRLVAQRLRRLGMGARVSGNVDRLEVEIDSLKTNIIAAVPNLDLGTAETIAFGVVSDWLMRCPLRLSSDG
jgi:hypothetical protein